MHRLVHDIPGRLRFVLPHLRGSGGAAETMRDQVRPLPGVSGVCASALTGSLLVTYDAQPETRARVIGMVGRLAPVTAPSLERQSAAEKSHRSRQGALANTALQIFAEALLERAIQRVAAALV